MYAQFHRDVQMQQEMMDEAHEQAEREYEEMTQDEFFNFVHDNCLDDYEQVLELIVNAIRRYPSEVIWMSDKLKDLWMKKRTAYLFDKWCFSKDAE